MFYSEDIESFTKNLFYLGFKLATDFTAVSFNGDEGKASLLYSDLVLGPSIF